jgi:hypothetical protein
MRSDGGGATDRRPRPRYHSIQWYLHPHSLPFRAVAFQRQSRSVNSSRLFCSTHSLERTLLFRVQRSATGRIATCPLLFVAAPHDYRVLSLSPLTYKEESRPGYEQNRHFVSRTRATTSTIVGSSPFTEMPSPVRYVPQPVASKLSALSVINRSSFPLSFSFLSLYFLL